VEIYRHVGDRVRVDLQKKHNIPPAKLSVLMSKFDTIRASGDMMPTAMGSTAIDGKTPQKYFFFKRKLLRLYLTFHSTYLGEFLVGLSTF